MMPVGPNIYVDGVSTRALITKARTLSSQKSQSQVQQQNSQQKPLDVTLADLEKGGETRNNNTKIAQDTTLSPAPQPLFTLDQDRTLTYDELKELPEQKPAYYDPQTQTAYTGLGIFLAGMGSLVRKDIDPIKLSPLAKAEYYTGRAVAEIGLAYGAGRILGNVLGRAPEIANTINKSRKAKQAVKLVSKVTKPIKTVTSKFPESIKKYAPQALKGTVRGALPTLFGVSEGLKAKEILDNKGTWGDVIGTLGGDFAGLYAFDRGLRTAFELSRKNVIRKNFARKNSRIFAGEIKKPTLVTKNDPEQIIMTRTPFEKTQQVPLKFKPTRTGMPAKTKEIDLMWLPEEVPNKNTLITRTINTKAKPRTTFKLETKTDDVLDVNKLLKQAKKQARNMNLADEVKFIEQENRLPEKLYTSDEKLWGELFKKEKTKPSTTAGGGNKQETVVLTKSTLKKVNVGKTRASEANRALQTKREFQKMMKSAEAKIASTTKRLSSIPPSISMINLAPLVFRNPFWRISEPPVQIQQPYWKLNEDIDKLKRELMKQRAGQTMKTAQKQGALVVPYWELDYDIDSVKTQFRKQNDIQKDTQKVTQTHITPSNIPPIEIQEPVPDEPWPHESKPPKTRQKDIPPTGKILPKARRPRVKPPEFSIPFVGEMLAEGNGYKGPWMGWGRKNNTPLFTITPIKTTNPFIPSKRGKGGKKHGVL